MTEVIRLNQPYKIRSVFFVGGDRSLPTATVEIEFPNGEIRSDGAPGKTTEDAIFCAIDRAIGEERTWKITSCVFEKSDSQWRCVVFLDQGGYKFYIQPRGEGKDGDVMIAAAYAYMSAVNKCILRNRQPLKVEA